MTTCEDCRVLVVEDEIDVAQMIQAVLEDEGYLVRVHPNGDCMDAFDSFQPHVVLCDYMLPLRDGEAVLGELRHVRRDNTPFIMISAMGRGARYWREWGADDFLAKPFDIDRLLGAVHRSVGIDSSHWTQEQDEQASDEQTA